MLSALLLMIVGISSINAYPYTLDDKWEVAQILERRGEPIVCDAGKSGTVVFVFDTADGTDDFAAEKAYAAKVAKFLPENGKVQVGGIVYGGTSEIVIPLGSQTTYDSLVAAINGISQELHGARDEAGALDAGDTLANGGSGVKVVVLFVDGAAADLNAAKATADKLRGEDIAVFLAFPKSLYGTLKTELQQIAAEPYSTSLNAMNSMSLAESLGIEFDLKYSC